MSNNQYDSKGMENKNTQEKRKLTYWQSREIFLSESIAEKELINENIPTSKKMISIALMLILSIIFDVFFIDNYFGISVFIYHLFIIAVFFYIPKEKLKLNFNLGWYLMMLSLLLSLRFSIYSNEIFSALNVLLVPVLIILSLLLIRYEEIEKTFPNYFDAFIQQVLPRTFNCITKPFEFLIESIKLSEVRESKNETKKNILIGVVISIPLVIVLIQLLSSADKMFEYYLSNAFDLINFKPSEAVGHSIFIIIFFIYTFAFVWSFNYPFRIFYYKKKKETRLDSTITVTLLIIINLLYALFSIIQTKYLYNKNTVLPQGITYSSYAREGFFQLVTVTIINLLIILIMTKITKYKNNKLAIFSKILMNITLLFTLMMLYASHYKLSLYEDVYGFTHLRFYVHYTILAILLLIIIFSLGIWLKKVHIKKYSLILLITMYVFINFFNVDTFIAKNNFQRYKKTNKIDTSYLYQLGPDAFPYIYSIRDNYNDSIDIKTNIDNYLNYCKNYGEKGDKWYEFNYNKYVINKTFSKTN